MQRGTGQSGPAARGPGFDSHSLALPVEEIQEFL
jgi:hypothetical protein